MPTRFYLTNAAPGYTPATKRGAWDNSAATLNRYLGPRPQGTATTSGQAETSTTNNFDVLLGRWISDGATTAGTLSGTVEWIIGVLESGAGANDFFHIHVFVTAGDTDTVRGTLLTDSVGATEWPTTTGAGRGEGTKAVSSLAISAGDRLVVEVGYQAQNTSATSFTGTVQYGGTGTTDRTSGSTTTSQPGWVEFSAADGLYAPPTSSIVDTFSTGTLDDPPWGESYGGATATAGQAVVPCAHTAGTPDYAGIQTDPFYRFDDLYAKVVPAPVAGATVNAFTAVAITDAATLGTSLHARVDAVAGTLRLESNVDYFDAAATVLTYNATDHAWLRIRRTGGNILWQTSPNGIVWTTRRTLAEPSWTRYGGLNILGEAARDGGTNNVAYFDNVNTSGLPPAAPAAHTTETPASGDVTDGTPIETGVRFTVAADTSIVGVIFRPPATNTGTYTAQLWHTDTSDDSTGTGTLLAEQAIDAADVGTGWARIPITPTAVTTGVVYTAAVHSSSGRYVATSGALLSAAITGGGVTLVQSGTDPIGIGTIRNGVFLVNATPGYPTSSAGGADYFIDVETTSTSGSTVTGTASSTLGGLAGTATGQRQTTATAASPLGSLTATAAGTHHVSGTATAPLGTLAGTAAGVRHTTGAGSAPLGAATATAVGTRAVAATATAGLGGLAGAATGTRSTQGQGVTNLGPLSGTATGNRRTTGAAATTLGGITATTVGRRTVAGTGAASLGPLAGTATGTTVGTGEGAGSAALGGLAATASGVRTTTGTATAGLGALTASATGDGVGTVAGTATAALGALSASAVGRRTVRASLTAALGGLVAAATGPALVEVVVTGRNRTGARAGRSAAGGNAGRSQAGARTSRNRAR